MMNGPVVVGYDQTPHSEHALYEAAREAAIRGTALKIIHAYTPRSLGAPTAAGTQTPATASEPDGHQDAEQVVQQAAAGVRAMHLGLTVEAQAIAGHPAKVLADAARGADLLVVGGRGQGGFTGLILGSVSLRVLADACCPVTVVHDRKPTEHGRIVMAVDIDEPGEEILRFAFEEASRCGATLEALHIWDEPWFPTYGEDDDVTAQAEEVETDSDARLDSLVRSWHAKFPEVHTEQRIGTGPAATVLVEAARTADLIVVGGRRHGNGRHGMRIGPVANTVLHHAACPVAIVPVG